jgi:pSer/pThr/pTyr-binding forkhead associated (FHA) protein
MVTVTFLVLEGIDRGRIFRDLPLAQASPITIGREEGNQLRLNDERVSRFHAKVQIDNGDVILTDLESTNGTKVNGKSVQIRRLRAGDQVSVGRTLLRFGSDDEIRARLAELVGSNPVSAGAGSGVPTGSPLPATRHIDHLAHPFEPEFDFTLNTKEDVTRSRAGLFIGNRPLPLLPQKMTPAQAARVAEILDLCHRGLSIATENIEANEEGTQVTLGYAEWQRILAVQMLLALYVRHVTEPDALEQ